ncbi:prolinerich protein [Striga asiatica]|uniref:Prolinerich protein n=1 Tax=Striga asiatica TaxID=4170 RepID=A0A5A7QGT6_STRAF|nr:prolinerich protein [Striga asiatica]
MAGKQIAGDGVPPSLAGMSKNQLYDIMSQMKTLIEQNKQQARQVLIQNPVLTRALFQIGSSRLELELVYQLVYLCSARQRIEPELEYQKLELDSTTPLVASHLSLCRECGYCNSRFFEESPAIPSTASQIPNPQPPPISNQKPNIQPTSSFPGQTSPNQVRNQQPNQIPSQNPNQTMLPRNPHPQPAPPNPQSQPTLSRPLQPQQQPKAHLVAQSTQMSMPPGPPQSSQSLNITQLPSQLTNPTQLPQHSVFQPSVPSLPPQSQQPMQSSGNPYLPLQQPLQPPLPPQMRGPMPGFPHQVHGQMGPNMGFQHPGGPPMHNPQQHMFHAAAKPHGGMGPAFPQGQLPHPPNQPLPPSLYQLFWSDMTCRSSIWPSARSYYAFMRPGTLLGSVGVDHD